MKFSVNNIAPRPPARPGVYFFKDQSGDILYIGKAANLRVRVRSHFKDGHKQSALYEKVAKIDWQETGSEIEALLLEAQLIKKHQPPYNVMFRDDKKYFFVGFTKEEYPKVFLTHQPRFWPQSEVEGLPKSASRAEPRDPAGLLPPHLSRKVLGRNDKQFIGPFTSGEELKATLRLLRKIFPYCTCKEKHKRPCLAWHLGRCLGACCLDPRRLPLYAQQLLEVEPPAIRAAYRRNVKNLKEILHGHTPRLLKRLKKEMAEAAKKQRFEKAAALRDQVEALESTLAHAHVLAKTLPPEEAEARTVPALAALKVFAGLAREPQRIEAYDISNIQGKFATGSMVVFENGAPEKSDYRMFRIKTVEGANDVAMLKEVLARRLKHPEWPLPALIIVDGGKAQVNALRSVIARTPHLSRKVRGTKQSQEPAVSYEIASLPAVAHNDAKHAPVVLGFAKGKERKGTELHLPDNRAIPFAELPDPLRNLLSHLDHEAHRFAIRYYRKLHRKGAKS